MPFDRTRSLLPALLLALVALALLAAPGLAAAKGGKFRATSSAQRSLGKAKKRTAARRPILWGALVGDQLTGHQAPWDMGGPQQLEAMLGKRMSLIHFMAPFSHCSSSGCGYYDFPAAEMRTIRRHGATPFFSWSSQSIPSREVEPDYQLGDVISGRYDGFIREWAGDAKRYGHPFFLRFNWEMNGDWFPWAEGANGNRPGEYVSAWRHVHDIFTRGRRDQRELGLVPERRLRRQAAGPALALPGRRLRRVDLPRRLQLRQQPAKRDRWRSFDQLYARTYAEVTERIAPSKPMVLGEIACSEQGGSKAEWIAEMLARPAAPLPEGPRPRLVRQVRKRDGLAARDLAERDRRLRGGDQRPALRRRRFVVVLSPVALDAYLALTLWSNSLPVDRVSTGGRADEATYETRGNGSDPRSAGGVPPGRRPRGRR